MRFYFTEEDRSTETRAREIRAALIHAYHDVVHGRSGAPAPEGVDVWMHGIGVAGSPPIEHELAKALSRTTAQVALFQLCDAPNFGFDQVPSEVSAKAGRFLRNHWPRSPDLVPIEFRNRLGFLPPMIKPMAPIRGKDLTARAHRAVFYGTRTGLDNLVEGKNAREECVRMMRQSSVPFVGGIVPHEDPRYEADPKLAAPKISGPQHRKLLSESIICLAPWGNHPITYRLFEGLALRCLVLAQSLRSTRFIDGGLMPGRHYVEVEEDLSDLVEKVDYFSRHLDEAQTIADAGHRHYATYLAPRGRLISRFVFEQAVGSWGSLYVPVRSPSVKSIIRSIGAQWLSKRA